MQQLGDVLGPGDEAPHGDVEGVELAGGPGVPGMPSLQLLAGLRLDPRPPPPPGPRCSVVVKGWPRRGLRGPEAGFPVRARGRGVPGSEDGVTGVRGHGCTAAHPAGD